MAFRSFGIRSFEYFLGRQGKTLEPYPNVETIAEYFFDGTSDVWTIVNNATTSADTTNYEEPRNGVNQALLVEPNASTFANIGINVSPAIDLSNAQGVLRVYLNENDGGNDGDTSLKVTTVGMRLRPTGSSLVLKNIWTINQQVTKGWIDITFDIPTQWDGTTLTAIDQIYLTISYDSGYTGSFTLGYLAFWERPQKAYVMLRLDDGLAGHYELAEIADSYGIPVHFGIAKAVIDGGMQLSLAQIQTINAMSAGHLILNHSNLIGGATGNGNPGWRWDDAGQTTLTSLSDRRDDAVAMRSYMNANGLGRYARYYIVPGGFDQRDDVDLIDDGSLDRIWYAGTDSTMNLYHVWPPQWRFNRLWRMPSGQLLDGQGSYTAFVTAALARNTFAILYGHNLDSELWDAMCEEIATQRDAGNLAVVTMQDIR